MMQQQMGGGMAPGAPGMMMPGGNTMPQATAPGLISCPGCAAKVPPGKFCAECGTSLAPPQPRPCPACATMVPPGGKFCLNCGTKMA
jgi:ribosomal protein L32